MTHSVGEIMAHAEELAAQMRELLPEPAEKADAGILAPIPTVPTELLADDLPEAAGAV